MISVYDKNTIDFNNGIVLNDCLKCEVNEELNGIYQLELEYRLDPLEKWKNIVEGNIVKAPTPKGDQLFRINYKRLTMHTVIAEARHIFYDLVDNFLEDVRPTDMSCQQALNWIFTHTQFPNSFTGLSDVSGTNTAYYVRKNPVEAILGNGGNSVISLWGGELERDNFTVKLLQQRGKDRGVKIAYGKNLTGLEEELNLDNIVTRIMPVGKDENDLPVLLPEKYVDSQYINNYPHPKIRTYEFDDIKVDENTTIDQVYSKLRDSVADLYTNKQVDIPFVNYKINFMALSQTVEYKNYSALETIYPSDIVTVTNSKLNINIKTKMIRYVYNAITKRYIEIELGSFKSNLNSNFDNVNNKINTVNQNIVNTKSDMQKAIDNATQLLNNNMGGYVLKRNGEILIMDNENPLNALKVWKWNLNGLGYSSTGINGSFNPAITMDGTILGNMVKAYSISTQQLASDVGQNLNISSNKAITTLSQNLNIKIGQIDSIDGQVKQINNYFDFGTNGLTIGKTDSPLNITISNSEMDFVDNGSVVAYINGQKMFIDSLDVLSSLIVGVHKIEKYNSDISFLRWVG